MKKERRGRRKQRAGENGIVIGVGARSRVDREKENGSKTWQLTAAAIKYAAAAGKAPLIASNVGSNLAGKLYL